MAEALLFSSITGFSTIIGSLLIYLIPMTRRVVTTSLGVSIGVMIWIVYHELIPTSIQYGGFFHMILGMGIGIGIMSIIHHLHLHQSGDSMNRLGAYLLLAMIIHNGPEGAAIGIGFGTETGLGLMLSIALIIHNIPEGLGMAAPFVAAGRSPFFVLGMAFLSGLVFPLGTWLGMVTIQSISIIAVGLSFAATVICWVVCEIGKKAWDEHPFSAWQGIMIGFIFMYILHLFHG